MSEVIGRPSCHSPLARLAAMSLLAGLILLVPAAHLTPPDQTWVAGLYDHGDHDDAVLAITDAVGLSPTGGPGLSLTSGPPARVGCAAAQPSDSRPRIALLDRAPPPSR